MKKVMMKVCESVAETNLFLSTLNPRDLVDVKMYCYNNYYQKYFVIFKSKNRKPKPQKPIIKY